MKRRGSSYNEESDTSPNDGGVMVAALNEVSGPSLSSLRPWPTPIAPKGAFGALLSISAPAQVPETAKALPAVPPGSLAPFHIEDGDAAPPVPEGLLASDGSPSNDAQTTDVEALAQPMRDAPAAAPPAPQRAASSGTALPAQQSPLAETAAREADTATPGSAKPAGRKPGTPDEKRAPPADAPTDAGPPGCAAQVTPLILPTLPPPARMADPSADRGEASGARDAGSAAPSAPASAPAAPDPAAPTGDAPAQASGDFRALVTPPPPAQGANPKPAAAPQRDRAAPTVAHGDALGLQIVRHIGAGKEALSVALSPDSLGRVEVQMRFDETGTLRAVVSASTPEALALLHRDSALLDQAMLSAGVRTDAQSFRFDSHAGSGGQHRPEARDQAERDSVHLPDSAEPAVVQPLRSSGTLDLLA